MPVKATRALAPRSGSKERRSSTDAVYETVLDRILSRELAGGTVLQERRLAERLRVSRTPLREVFRRLEGEGLVVRVNRAVMVKAVTITDYIEVLRVRAVLEGEACARAAGRVEAGAVAALRARIHDLLASAAPEPGVHWALNDAVHELIATAAGNDLMAVLIRSLRLRTRIFNLRRMPDRLRPGCREHLEILDALEAGAAEAARASMVAHLGNVERSIIERLVEG